MCCLVKGGEIAKNLLALCTYVLEELVSANIEDRSECLDRAIRTLTELRESWVEVEKITRAGVQEVTLAAHEAVQRLQLLSLAVQDAVRLDHWSDVNTLMAERESFIFQL